ncbi:MAG: DUF362 domain-containing protein, partial [bacterium]|nr:DUF362 domain-containing protein [bacterium]
FWWRWFATNTIISGTLALIWLLLRSGSKPSRFTYPCQQAAISTATLAFGGPVVAAIIAGRRHLSLWIRMPIGIATLTVGLLATAACWGYFLKAAEYSGPVLAPRDDYRAALYHVADCPQDPTGSRFLGLDNLLATMGADGLKFYRSDTISLVGGPDGIIAADDVIVIKINYQWDECGGTNTDLLRGLIRRIVDHQDTFTGEVVVCENAQFNSVQGFDRAQNNAQDHGLSPHDVVLAFQAEGHDVSHYDWTSVRYASVGEYSEGDTSDGYVVYDYDSELHGRVSYPKFQSDAGTLISLRHGIWAPVDQSYDRQQLKFINLPVLKSHHATYGATVSVKHYMGVVTRELSTSSHNAIHYGILGALLGEIQLADLNILDRIWINADPNDGPWTTYGAATRRNELVAGVDPVAVDIWAVKNILIPAFLANGYTPPWPYPSADPDLPGSAFRNYLDNSMSRILAAGLEVTNDLTQIDTESWDGAGDLDGDSDVDRVDFELLDACLVGPGGGLLPACGEADFDGNGDVDLYDFARMQQTFTGAGVF